MATYCYTLSIDGQEETSSADWPDEAAATAHGLALLRSVISLGSPASVYVAVSVDEGADDEPLGAWDWSREAPEIVWAPAA